MITKVSEIIDRVNKLQHNTFDYRFMVGDGFYKIYRGSYLQKNVRELKGVYDFFVSVEEDLTKGV